MHSLTLHPLEAKRAAADIKHLPLPPPPASVGRCMSCRCGQLVCTYMPGWVLLDYSHACLFRSPLTSRLFGCSLPLVSIGSRVRRTFGDPHPSPQVTFAVAGGLGGVGRVFHMICKGVSCGQCMMCRASLICRPSLASKSDVFHMMCRASLAHSNPHQSNDTTGSTSADSSPLTSHDVNSHEAYYSSSNLASAQSGR